MAKFKNVGYIGTSKKDAKKFNLCMELNGTKTYFLLKGKPSEAEAAENPRLSEVRSKWPDWKKYDVIHISDDDK